MVERGMFSKEEFHDYINTSFGTELTKTETKSAWNALLLEIDIKKVDLLKDLAERSGGEFSIVMGDGEVKKKKKTKK